jgi:hypothetical protein
MSTSDGTVIGTTKILDHGPANARWNIVIMSDGYQAGQLSQFAADAQKFVSKLLATSPYDVLQRAINVFRVDVSSTDSGADDPVTCTGGTGATARTYFDASFCNNGIQRLLEVNETTALTVAAAQVPEFHVAIVIVNSTTYGGSGGGVATFSVHPDAGEIALHEIGHSAFDLADEYEYYVGCGLETDHDVHPATEPVQPNVTIDSDRATIKWRDLIAATTSVPTTRNADCTKCDPQASPVPLGTIGAFEGAHYYHCGAFRPAFDCRMRHLGIPYCAVCERVIRQRLQVFLPPEVDVAILVVDPQASGEFGSFVAAAYFAAAMNAVLRVPHSFGAITFPNDSAQPTIPAAVTDLRTRLLAAFPSPAVALATYLSRAGDPSAGSLAVRDARRDLIHRAATTETQGGAGSFAAASFDVGPDVFSAAAASGVTQSAIMVVELSFSSVGVAVLAVADPQLVTQYSDQISSGDFFAAMRTACADLHVLGLVSFEGESAQTIPAVAISVLKPRFTGLFPSGSQIVTFPDHFSRAGDAAAGTIAAREARRTAIQLATTTSGGVGSAPGAGIIEVPAAVFDIPRAAGVNMLGMEAIVVVTPTFF